MIMKFKYNMTIFLLYHMLQVTVESSSYGERDRDRDREKERDRDRDRDRDRERMGINIKAPLVAERLEPLTEKGLLFPLRPSLFPHLYIWVAYFIIF